MQRPLSVCGHRSVLSQVRASQHWIIRVFKVTVITFLFCFYFLPPNFDTKIFNFTASVLYIHSDYSYQFTRLLIIGISSGEKKKKKTLIHILNKVRQH